MVSLLLLYKLILYHYHYNFLIILLIINNLNYHSFLKVHIFLSLLLLILYQVMVYKSIYYILNTLFSNLRNIAISKSQGKFDAANKNTLFLDFNKPSN